MVDPADSQESPDRRGIEYQRARAGFGSAQTVTIVIRYNTPWTGPIPELMPSLWIPPDGVSGAGT